jgi:hypothetical protein
MPASGVVVYDTKVSVAEPRIGVDFRVDGSIVVDTMFMDIDLSAKGLRGSEIKIVSALLVGLGATLKADSKLAENAYRIAVGPMNKAASK